MRPVKLAFLVGVSDYGDSAKNLDFCEDDVRRLAGVLERKGFTSKQWVNKPLTDILQPEVLRDFFNNAQESTDTVIFYFTGHGEDLGGEQLLLGKNVKRANMSRALNVDDVLPLSRVLEMLADLPAQKIVIVDACRVPSVDQSPALELYKARANAINSLSNCAIVFASADGKKSFGSPDNSCSRFTYSLTEELKKYGNGLLSIVEATTTRVSKYNDGHNQTPWVYASIQERALDGFSITNSQMVGPGRPKNFSSSENVIWSILSGSNSLAKYELGKWVPLANLRESLTSGMTSFDCRLGGAEFVFVRHWKKTLAIALVSFGSVRKLSKVKTRLIGAQSMNRFFGAYWSPEGKSLLAFGAPIRGGTSINIWNFSNNCKEKLEDVEGIPIDVDCNSASWISESRAIASFCQKESSYSYIYLLEIDGGKWKGTSIFMTPHPMRITALTISQSSLQVFCGSDDGAVVVFDLENPNEPILIPRQHSCSGLNHIGPVPWTGPSRKNNDLGEVGVCCMEYDESTKLLGITYLDSTIAFLDTVLGTYVKSLILPGLPRRPNIALVNPSTFISQGHGGLQYDIQLN
jgi:WD40 repeat protein